MVSANFFTTEFQINVAVVALCTSNPVEWHEYKHLEGFASHLLHAWPRLHNFALKYFMLGLCFRDYAELSRHMINHFCHVAIWLC